MFDQDFAPPTILPKKSNYENVSVENVIQLKTFDQKSKLGVKKVTKTECCVDHGFQSKSKVRLDEGPITTPNNDLIKVAHISKLDYSLVNVVQNSIGTQVSFF